MIYWFTGQPSHGKTTLSKKLYKYHKDIYENKIKSITIDDDDFKENFNSEEYSELNRRKNIKLAQDIALFMHNKGYDVYVSLVTPYKDMREDFKALLNSEVKEFYVYCSKERQREMYKLKNYQQPTENFTFIDTTIDSIEQSMTKILQEI
jgi:adenylylsulfate kinase-like enzyme